VKKLLFLYKEDIIDFSVETGGIDHWDGVQDGNILMTDEGPWFYNLLNETEMLKTAMQTIPVPFPHTNGPASIIGGEHLVILKGSQNSDEAWTFIKWMSQKKSQLIMSREGLIPSNIEAAKALNLQHDSFVFPYLKGLQSSFSRPPVKNWSRIDEVYTQYLNKIFLGDLTIEDGLDLAAEEIDKLLDENKGG
jgi:multiple sugar transport system substrate-binding protein